MLKSHSNPKLQSFLTLLVTLSLVSILKYNLVYAYSPPIGIPDPGFGITDARPIPPAPWNIETIGYYHINYQTGTDSGRTYGTPSAPRKTIPNPIPAGSYVEVAGTYSYGGSTQLIQGLGSLETPVWLVGVDQTQPTFTGNVYFFGTYLYVDGFNFTGSANIRGNNYTAHHIVIKNCDIDAAERTGMAIVGTSTTNIHNIVIYNCRIHDTSANWNDGSGADTDYHGILPGNYAYNIWILDNTFYNIAGNAIQIGGANPTIDGLNHVYVGNNTISKTRQSGIGIKKSSDIIISSNNISDSHETYNGTGSNYCAGVSYQYAPQRLWIINNIIYDADHGIKSGGSTSPAGDYVYIIGNVIYNIHNPNHVDINGGWATGSGMRVQGIQQAYVINNTIHDADVGIAAPQQNMNLYVENNIISDIDYNHITYDSASTATDPYGTLKNNIIHQPTEKEVLRISNTTYDLASYPYGSDNKSTDPRFTSIADGQYFLTIDSPAKDTGIPSNVYATFKSLYGISIEKDIAGITRPQNSSWDIGAYEFSDSSNSSPPVGSLPPTPPPAEEPTPIIKAIIQK